MSEQLHSIKEVLEDLKAGKPVIIVDDESRETKAILSLQLSLLHKKILILWLNTRAVLYVPLCVVKL